MMCIRPPTGALAASLLITAIALPASAATQDPEPPEPDTAVQEAAEEKDLPLEPDRTIAFTTREGSWLSLDVSPDGETIVFELLGDLYTLPVDGGRATRITEGMAFDAQPRYSPDDDRIVFISDRSGGENLWIADADGTDPRALTEGGHDDYISPEWTPDGDYVVASKAAGFGTHKLWLYHEDGGSGTALMSDPEELNMIGAAFGADPRYLYFSRKQGGFEYNQLRFGWEVAVYDRETGEVSDATDAYGGGMRPTLSPDGRWLVYATRHDEHTGLRLRDLETGDERWLAHPVQRDDQESRFTRDLMPGMAFTPDSRHLIASHHGKIWRIAVPAGAQEEIPFTADVEQQLGPLAQEEYRVPDGPVVARQIRGAALSPDGRAVAFTALDRLWIQELPEAGAAAADDAAIRLDGARRLTGADVGEHQPAWSPDGEWIAYVTWSPDGGHIWRARPDGEGAERLTEVAAYYDAPAWSPDGERIVAIKAPRSARIAERRGPGRELHWLPADGGPTTKIAPISGRAGEPHFADAPDRIYLYDAGDGLVSMRWDGTDRRVHVQVTGYRSPGAERASPASEVLMGPDGETALAVAEGNVYTVTVPVVGGEAPSISVMDPEGAAFPVKRLTRVGGHFPGWAADGESVHWSIGRHFFRYDFAAAEAAASEDETPSESAEDASSQDDPGAEGAETPAYEPVDHEIRVVAERDRPQETVALTGARLITMRGGGEVIEDGVVVVEGDRIEAVGARGAVEVPAGAETIDVSGATIMPGLVDIHAHLRPPFGIHKTQVWEYLANLAYGVTATRDPQTSTTDVLSYGDRVATGELIGPRIFSTGPGVFSSTNIESLEDARDVLERYSEYYQTRTIKQYMAGNRQQRQWVIMAAEELGLIPTTEGALDMMLNLTQIIDGYPGHEHSFPIYPLYEDVVEFVAQSGTVYTPTLLVAYGGPFAENYFYQNEEVHDDPKLRRFTPHAELDSRALRRPWFREEQHVFPELAKAAADIVEAGGRVGLGGHGQLQGLGVHWELWAIQSGGMSEHDALRVATIFGAEAIGYGRDLGSLEAGKLADLLVLERNPLDDIRNTNTIRHVMKNGRLYEGDTLDEIWPRQRELAPQWWWDRTPEPVTAEQTY